MKLGAFEWKERIHKWGMELGFIAVGFTTAERNEGLYNLLEQRCRNKVHTSFEEKNLDLRCDPKAVWELCQTVAVFAYPLPLSTSPEENEGSIARSAVGEDYHRIVLTKLYLLIEKLTASGWPSEPPRLQVDTGPLNERALAARAGIGWLGRNQQLIVPGYGSFVALGLMLIDQKLPEDQPIAQGCGECRQCQTACPAQIIGQDPFAANECLSYLTQNKELLNKTQMKSLGTNIYGCDLCQEACPHNRKAIERSLKGQQALHRGVDLWHVLNLTKGQFNQDFKPTAAGWRGKGILQRNAFLALKNLNDERLNQWIDERKHSEFPPLIEPYIKER